MNRIASRFGRSAAHYDEAATVQRHVAAELARRIGGLALPARPRILDVGCGTGALAGLLAARFAPRLLCLADLAPAMAAAARRPVAGGAAALAMDGERPCFAEGSFDLVCGSMSFQWFADPAKALAGLCRLLAPGGHLAFATLAGENFPEWRQALAALGLPAGTHRYPAPEAWRDFLPPGAEIAVERHAEPYGSAREFLGSLRHIGADTPARGYRPLAPGQLRRVLRRHESGMAVTYAIVYAVYARGVSG